MAGCEAVADSGWEMRAIFLGPPGAGKGTQASLLSRRKGVPCFASGDILREAVRKGEPVGKEALSYMEAGTLVPDELMTRILLGRLELVGKAEPFILDGFPRTRSQAEALEGRLASDQQAPIDVTVDFEISEEKVIRRLAGRRVCGGCGANYHLENLPPKKSGVCDRCGGPLRARLDDEPQTIRRRMEVYRNQTEPLLEFYRAQGKLRTISGDLSVEDQYQALLELLKREQLV